jgi:hypothetical protein
VKDELGQGRVGTVYSVDVVSPQDNIRIPPLAIKVSDRYRSRKVAREAWFYEEMEHLQGASIPRCYGFFEVELSEEYEVLNWRDVCEESAEEADEEERDCVREGVWSRVQAAETKAMMKDLGAGAYNVISASWGEEQTEERVESPDPAAGLSFIRKHHLISILVLERLGERLPLGVPIEEAVECVC